jgi:prepilin-type N-terminal cleavage/methylation domain-containing protein
MSLRIDNIKNEKGMTLIEVMAALVLLSLLAVTVLNVFSTTGGWITGAGKKAIAIQYANSIIDSVKANSVELVNIDFTEPAPDPDKNEIDDEFNFSWAKKDGGKFEIMVPAPANTLRAEATIVLSKYNDDLYYMDANGNEVISADDRYFKDNLFDVKAKIEWNEGENSGSIELSTIMGAK